LRLLKYCSGRTPRVSRILHAPLHLTGPWMSLKVLTKRLLKNCPLLVEMPRVSHIQNPYMNFQVSRLLRNCALLVEAPRVSHIQDPTLKFQVSLLMVVPCLPMLSRVPPHVTGLVLLCACMCVLHALPGWIPSCAALVSRIPLLGLVVADCVMFALPVSPALVGPLEILELLRSPPMSPVRLAQTRLQAAKLHSLWPRVRRQSMLGERKFPMHL
jgi:hypothetical protein